MERTPNREEIERRAYEIYESRGCEEGRALEDWLAAEEQLTKELLPAEKPVRASEQQPPRPRSKGSPPPAAARSSKESLSKVRPLSGDYEGRQQLMAPVQRRASRGTHARTARSV